MTDPKNKREACEIIETSIEQVDLLRRMFEMMRDPAGATFQDAIDELDSLTIH